MHFFRKTLNPGPSNTKENTVPLGKDVAFECHAVPSTSRSLPMRSCKAASVHYDDNSSSDDDIYDYPKNDFVEYEQPNLIENEKSTNSSDLDESENGDNLNNENSSESGDELEQEANLNESAKNCAQDEVSDSTEDEINNEEENMNNGEFNWSDVDFEEMYNDKEQMKKLMEYDEECKNSKFIIVETPIHPPNESSDEDNEEKLYALGFL